ncbi:glycoside hydrolase family 35 [Beutenbergia cavernae DSM 12333]|uniref:Glycoside hydrolase family 35 n=1 Tax=Beutenbergia cavernae (strain ATCC BAA-8 / DSM 12333 / CCUG 43141 / JCM 11478 / NBRC 16432 / NCIMB 13614 / HKI 0122) TaxID=471853 RepID=C5C215_BEUC1|nr:beta-galactosidase [Beutenbergia cavernae]ACQ81640.1 glycoside hydrolase family 35 [Beutenbergia cavernae DSM 12333]
MSVSRPRTVRLAQGRIEIDGVPRLVLAGEVHYFRTERAEWPARLRDVVDAGLDTVATYVPWIFHELPDGTLDLSGATRPERDLAAYLDLANAAGLDVLVRPGPFVMAELKNEGIPYRVYADHPEIQPVGWSGRPAPTRDADLLAPAFLTAGLAWFDGVLDVVLPRLASRGGPVTGIQLDNEVGMLAWVTNTPHLTDAACADLRGWLSERYDATEIARRTGAPVGASDADFATAVRAGGTDGGDELALHHDVGLFHRDRFARYLRALEDRARERGVDVPLVVNVHGSDAGRATTFGIGISQLAQAYRGRPQVAAGWDLYLGDLDVGNAADLYVVGAQLHAVNDPDQPLTALEFEAGNGDYGEALERLVPPSALDLKTRLALAQETRLLNYYLFAGGRNPRLDVAVGDGNDRLAFTGERHGFAAPIDPEGRRTAGFDGVRDVVRRARALGGVLAAGQEEHDDVVLGFVGDHYLTEYAHPDATGRQEQRTAVERYRGLGERSVLGRGLLYGGFSFGALDLQAHADPGGPWAAGAALRSWEPGSGPVVALATSRVLGAPVQELLARHVLAGGRLLLVGRLPEVDDAGAPCRILADALGVADAGEAAEAPGYFPSVRTAGALARVRDVEVRVSGLQRLDVPEGADVLLTEVGRGGPVAAHVRAGRGSAVVVGCDYPCHLDVWRELLGVLGVRPRIGHDAVDPGLVATTSAHPDGRVLHLVNVAGYPLAPALSLDGAPVAGGRAVEVAARTGLMLPIGLRVGGWHVAFSTAELLEAGDGVLRLAPTQSEDVVRLRDLAQAPRAVLPDGAGVPFAATDEPGAWELVLPRSAHADRPFEVRGGRE